MSRKKTGGTPGQQAGQHRAQDNFRSAIGAHVHEDGEGCQGYHGDTRCTLCAERWAMAAWTICNQCFAGLTPTHRPDGSQIPIPESNATFHRVREEYAT